MMVQEIIGQVTPKVNKPVEKRLMSLCHKAVFALSVGAATATTNNDVAALYMSFHGNAAQAVRE